MSSIRTNSHPVILTGSRAAHGRAEWQQADNREDRAPLFSHNVVLDYARDSFDSGDRYAWASELLWASQQLRMMFDSPRIGGGIDPALATGVDSATPEDGSMAGDVLEELMRLEEQGHGDYVQDCIVHAEAVAVRYLAAVERADLAY